MHRIIDWFTRNGVAANLLLVFIVLIGLRALFHKIPLEVFPDFELDRISISVPYRGATPKEVEEAVVIRIEEAIQDLQGIKEIISLANENSASISIEVEKGTEVRNLLDDIKNRVDAISTFPGEVEEPIISQVQSQGNVISVVVSGDMAERELRRLGERVRENIVNLPGITQASLKAVRPYEISIEVSEKTLREHGFTFDQLTRAIRSSSLDIPAGTIKTKGGEILLRTKGQAYSKEDFEKIVLLTRTDGSRLTLGDVTQIIDGFEETPLYARFNGKRAIFIDVSRVGDQNAIKLAKTVKDYLSDLQTTMPPGVELTYWRDASRIVKGRLKTLTSSAMTGGFLVFLVLALFLRFTLAVWVCVGIPVSFLGAIALMPALGVTINIISLFAFILVMGVVVDDAIVVGENIYTHLQHREDAFYAATEGTKQVAIPVIFGVLTTMMAFLPLGMVEGIRGKIFLQIPMIVIPVLFFSLVESQLILPSHLKHLKIRSNDKPSKNPFLRLQKKVSQGLVRFINRVYMPLLDRALRRRILTLSVFMTTLIVFIAIVKTGHMTFVYFPRVESEHAKAELVMPAGIPIEVTAQGVRRLEEEAEKLREKYIDPETGRSVIENILAVVGRPAFGRRGGSNRGKSHLGGVSFEITPPEKRTLKVTSNQLLDEWRKAIGVIPGAKDLNFRAEIGHGGHPIDIQLNGPDFNDLILVSEKIKKRLREYPGIFDITDSFDEGKQEIQLSIKPEAEHLGLTLSDLARQVRQAFFGEEAQRIQRDRDDVRVMVRYPKAERRSIANLESMYIRTSDGSEVPFINVAEIKTGRGFSSIRRVDRARTLNVNADADKRKIDVGGIREDLAIFVQEVIKDYLDVSFTFVGEAREQRESFGSLQTGLLMVLFGIYAMLAVPFRSYLQPLIVMSVIPFGLVGAILGHMIMGKSLSIMSVFGMLALIGVVVNDSLVLVDWVNQRRREGIPLMEAVHQAGGARFRAILLTSLTTFCGLMPLIFEKSTQAQFLIPMAISLGFGILFATFITLILVPINYLLLEDIKIFISKTFTRFFNLKQKGLATNTNE